MVSPRNKARLALVYNKTKSVHEAEVLINELKKISLETLAGSPDYFIGWYYCGIGKPDSASYWLERAYRNKSPEFPYLKIDPVFNSLKPFKQYGDLYDKTGHQKYDEYLKTIKNKG